jgi:hypothetical protein
MTHAAAISLQHRPSRAFPTACVCTPVHDNHEMSTSCAHSVVVMYTSLILCAHATAPSSAPGSFMHPDPLHTLPTASACTHVHGDHEMSISHAHSVVIVHTVCCQLPHGHAATPSSVPRPLTRPPYHQRMHTCAQQLQNEYLTCSFCSCHACIIGSCECTLPPLLTCLSDRTGYTITNV